MENVQIISYYFIAVEDLCCVFVYFRVFFPRIEHMTHKFVYFLKRNQFVQQKERSGRIKEIQRNTSKIKSMCGSREVQISNDILSL